MIGVALTFLVMLVLLAAARRESHRIAPAVVFTPAVDLPDVGDYELASSRIRPEILHDIEVSA